MAGVNILLFMCCCLSSVYKTSSQPGGHQGKRGQENMMWGVMLRGKWPWASGQVEWGPPAATRASEGAMKWR